MATILYRGTPGSSPPAISRPLGTGETIKNNPLTITEVDTNFANINLDLIEATADSTALKLVRRDASGNITVNDLNSTSDLRLKDDISKIDSPCNILKQINGIEFKWKETHKKSYGVIAQELEKVLPELVSNDGSYLSVSYIPLIAILIEAVKEQETRINELETRINK
jgi:hypothetical protein